MQLLVFCFATMTAVAFTVSCPSAEPFRPRRAAEPFPPITKFPVVSAREANRKLAGAELVLGVVVQGTARAYPINMLTGPQREIINDTLAGRPIAATW